MWLRMLALFRKEALLLLKDRKITLDVDTSARDWLAEAGFDPAYGARPLKRVIQRHLQNPLATMLLDGTIADGETVKVSGAKDGLRINGKLARAA